MVSDQSSSDSQKLAKQNFNLERHEFDALVESMKNGDDRLFKQVIFAHFSDCRAYLRKNLKISSAEAYDASVDALLLFGKRIKQDKIQYGNLRFLFTQMAKQAHLGLLRSKKPMVTLEEAGNVVERFDGPDKEMLQLLDKAWTHLKDTCQRLLKGVFYEEASIKDMAVALGITAPTARKQKERCMKKLQQIFKTFQ